MKREELAEEILELVEKYNDEFPKEMNAINTVGVAILIGADVVINILNGQCNSLYRAMVTALFHTRPELLAEFKGFLDETGAEYNDEDINEFSGLSPEQIENIEDVGNSVFKDYIDSMEK